MCPIKGLSEQRRLPRLGKIRLGRKEPNKNGNGEHPVAVNHFVLPPELEAIYGKECRELPVMIPTEDDEAWANQYYKRYSSSRGLTCRGDGVTCRRMLDTQTGSFADRDTKEVAWKDGIPCDGTKCPEYQVKPKQRCKEVMNLLFIMPDVPGLGVWQVDTSSINSIRNINSAAAMVRAVYKRLAFIPLLLTIEPTEVVNPDDGHKKTVHVLNLRVRGTMRELMAQATKPFAELMMPPPVEEAPDDAAGEEVLECEVVKVPPTAEQKAQAEKDIDELYGKAPDKPAAAATARSAPVPHTTAEQDFDNMKRKEKPLRDVSTIKKLRDLVDALRDDFGMTPQQAFTELNIKGWVDLTMTPADAYIQMRATHSKE